MTTTARKRPATAKKFSKQGKQLYSLWSDDSELMIKSGWHYTLELAIMDAMRELKKMKRHGTAPSHATLYLGADQDTMQRAQGFKRT